MFYYSLISQLLFICVLLFLVLNNYPNSSKNNVKALYFMVFIRICVKMLIKFQQVVKAYYCFQKLDDNYIKIIVLISCVGIILIVVIMQCLMWFGGCQLSKRTIEGPIIYCKNNFRIRCPSNIEKICATYL